MKKQIYIITLCLLLASSLFAGGAKEENAAVLTDGSTSMEKVIGALGEAFMNQNTGITFTYNPTGSGSGISAVQEGRCDIGLSSRSLKDSEVASGLVETTLAYDGIAIVVNKDNLVSNLTLSQVGDIFTGKIKSWAEVGGRDEAIVLIGREAGSGTRDGFETITGTKEKCLYRQELTSTGDVLASVSQNPASIGYASLSAVKANVKALSVDGVTPSEETIKDGRYKVQRPFVLVTKQGVALSGEAQRFFDFCMSTGASSIIAKAGVVDAE